MENLNILVNMENLTKDERKQLMNLVEKGKEHKRRVWKPEDGEVYFVSYSNGEIDSAAWTDGKIDNECYNLGNCFKTRGEAEFALYKRKVEVELKRFADEHNEEEIDWHNPKYKYYIAYNTCYEKINIYATSAIKENVVYFTSKEITKQAIQEIGEERLKKYYFEVTE